MELTKDNLRVFAAKYYDNIYCISEEEFDSDLKQVIVIKKMMTRYMNGNETNLALLVNNFIVFFNCFDHYAATRILEFHIDDSAVPYYNAILKFLSFPLIAPPDDLHGKLYQDLKRLYSNENV